nr:hypothetical protein [Micromonospora sp. DSM 115978]
MIDRTIPQSPVQPQTRPRNGYRTGPAPRPRPATLADLAPLPAPELTTPTSVPAALLVVAALLRAAPGLPAARISVRIDVDADGPAQAVAAVAAYADALGVDQAAAHAARLDAMRRDDSRAHGLDARVEIGPVPVLVDYTAAAGPAVYEQRSDVDDEVTVPMGSLGVGWAAGHGPARAQVVIR